MTKREFILELVKNGADKEVIKESIIQIGSFAKAGVVVTEANTNAIMYFLKNANELSDFVKMIALKALVDGVVMDVYLESNDYDAIQLEQIYLGLKAGVDVSLYSDPNRYDSLQMYFVREGLEAGFDVSVYNKPREFDWKEMQRMLGDLFINSL